MDCAEKIEAAKARKREYMRRYRQDNLEAMRAKDRAYRAANREKVAAGIERWREANPGRVQGYKRQYYLSNTDLVKARTSEWRTQNPERYKDNYLKAVYGISLHEYAAMAHAQEGRCAICSRHPKVLVVDHQHSTGKIRQLLCGKCNLGLGHFKDDPEAMRRAADYIERHGAH